MYQLIDSHKPSYTVKKKTAKVSSHLGIKSFQPLCIFGELGKKIFSNKFLPVAISPSAKNSRFWLPPTQRSLQQWLYIGKMFKKSLNVNDTRFGFYSHFKKGTFGLLYGNHRRKWVKISKLDDIFWVMDVDLPCMNCMIKTWQLNLYKLIFPRHILNKLKRKTFSIPFPFRFGRNDKICSVSNTI